MAMLRTKTIFALLAGMLVAVMPLAADCVQAQSAGPPPNSQSEYARAESLVRNHQWDDGLAILNPLLTRDPRNVKALNLAGLAYVGKGDVQQANQHFQRCLDVDPGFTPALKNLAINEFNAHQYPSAERHFLSLQKQLPDDAVISLFLGQLAYREQRFKQAAEELDRARGLVLHNPSVTAALIVSYLRSDQKEQAQQLLSKASAAGLDPANLDKQSQLALGISLAENSMDVEAIPYLNAAFHSDPDSYDIGFDLVLASIQAKDYSMAFNTADELIRRGHDTSEIENLRAETMEASGQTQHAVDAYRKAIELDPQDENNYLDFASLCIDHRAFDDGMKVIAVGLQIHPKSERLTFMHGILNAMQDHFESAEQDFKQAALLAPQHDFGIVGLGVTYLEIGNAEEAVKIIRARLVETPNDASLQYLLGEGLIRSGAIQGQPAYVEAQTALEKSVRLNPALCLPHVSLGSIYMDEDRYSEAKVQFEQARAIDPTEKSSYSHLAVVYRHLGQPEKAREALTALKLVLEQQRAGMKVKVQSSAEQVPAEEPTLPKQ